MNNLKTGLSAVIFFASFLLFISTADAASLYFEPSFAQFGKSDQFEVELFVNSEGQIINAIEGEIIYPNDLLKLLNIDDSNSIINIWIEKPRQQEEGRVFLSGIVPGGFSGVLKPLTSKKHPGGILTLTFESLQKGSGSVAAKDVQILLHDGLGTPTNVSTSNLSFDVLDYVGDKKVTAEHDTTPPEEFEIEISRNESIFDDKYFLVFNTQDKGSGIYYYKVKEGDGDFEVAESPHVLKNQELYYDIIVRAIDRAGNIREEKLPARNEKPSYPVTWIWIILLVLIILFTWVYRRKV